MLPIRLVVPGLLRYRAVAVRMVAEAARMVSGSRPRDEADDARSYDLRDPFDAAVVSAFGEIFNNVAVHAYDRKGGGSIEIAITPSERDIWIEVRDEGQPFALADVAPMADIDPDGLPERGMGIHIAKTMLDEMIYEPGPPNLWRLCKRIDWQRGGA